MKVNKGRLAKLHKSVTIRYVAVLSFVATNQVDIAQVIAEHAEVAITTAEVSIKAAIGVLGVGAAKGYHDSADKVNVEDR